jgi:hypothetical protein
VVSIKFKNREQVPFTLEQAIAANQRCMVLSALFGTLPLSESLVVDMDHSLQACMNSAVLFDKLNRYSINLPLAVGAT